MSGLTNIQVNELRHTGFPFDDRKIQYCLSALWYSTSDESYAQRTAMFDNSIFCKDSSLYKPIVDYYTMAYMNKTLRLDVIKQYTGNATDLEVDLAALYGTERNVILLHNPKREKSFLYSFDHKVRNAIAHGTMNFDISGGAKFYGQFNKKQDSPVNLFISLNAFELLSDWFKNMFELHAYNLEEFQRETYQMYFGELIENRYDYCELRDGTIVIFDNSFEFKSKIEGGDQESQIAIRIETVYLKHSIPTDAKVNYLIPIPSNSLFKKVIAVFPNTSIIAENQLLEHFGIQN